LRKTEKPPNQSESVQRKRSILLLTLKEGCDLEPNEMLEHLSGKIVSWWMPDKVAVIDQMPMTATGKIRKLNLRERYWTCLNED
jgi:acyl-CoA synthetase (AMP-forming)/AMP-acid ligase II